jgi:hypothetical protein
MMFWYSHRLWLPRQTCSSPGTPISWMSHPTSRAFISSAPGALVPAPRLLTTSDIHREDGTQRGMRSAAARRRHRSHLGRLLRLHARRHRPRQVDGRPDHFHMGRRRAPGYRRGSRRGFHRLRRQPDARRRERHLHQRGAGRRRPRSAEGAGMRIESRDDLETLAFTTEAPPGDRAALRDRRGADARARGPGGAAALPENG